MISTGRISLTRGVIMMSRTRLYTGRTLLLTLGISITLGIFYQPTSAAGADLPPLPDESLLADPVFARPGFENVAQPFLTRSRYLVSILVDAANGRLIGHERLLFVNNTGTMLD